MKNLIPITLVSLILLASAGIYSHAIANNNAVVITGEYSNPDTIPTRHRIYMRFIWSLRNQLVDNGFKVFDESLITLKYPNQGRVRRSDTEIIDIVNHLKTKRINYLIFFSIRPTFIKSELNSRVENKTLFKLRVTVRILDVGEGTNKGNFEVNGALEELPKNCSSPCLMEKVGSYAVELAGDVGTLLEGRLRE